MKTSLEHERSATDLVAHAIDLVATLDNDGPCLRSLLAVNPAAMDLARDADGRRGGGHTSRLHGLPILIKDNVDTYDMPTTAGSLALSDEPVRNDAPIVMRLRRAGAIPFGKANMSEWSHFRANRAPRGWSARGGLVRNPYALERTAGGSSSGSAVAVAAGIVPLAIGTETDASIIEPAAFTGVVGIKPTVGMVSTQGIVPISSNMDTAGPIARRVRDAAALLDVIRNDRCEGERGPRPSSCLAACTEDSLRGRRVAVLHRSYWTDVPDVDSLMGKVVACLAEAGALADSDVMVPHLEELGEGGYQATVLLSDFKADLPKYLSARGTPGPTSLEQIVHFNEQHADEELQHFGQDIFEAALSAPGPDNPSYLEALRQCRLLGGEKGIDAALRTSGAECLIYPAFGVPWVANLEGEKTLRANGPADPLTAVATAGYPVATIPIGQSQGLPVGIVIIGSARSEPTLCAVAHGLEVRLNVRLAPPLTGREASKRVLATPAAGSTRPGSASLSGTEVADTS